MNTKIDGTIIFLPEDKATFARLDVIAVYLFGSRAQRVAGPLSDFDFGILMGDEPLTPAKEQDVYTELYTLFSSRIQSEIREDTIIDIVFLQSQRVPLELKAYIITHGIVLFDTQPLVRLAIEERLLLQNADFAPLRKEMSQTLLARL